MQTEYVFEFLTDQGDTFKKAFWAYSEDDAYQVADNWAYDNRYVDFRMIERGDTMNDVSKLKLERLKRGLSADAVGKAIGVSGRTVAAWENGTTPAVDAAMRLAKYYGVSVYDLFSAD